MRVRYTVHDPPRAARVEMVRGPWFLRRFAASFELVPDGDRTIARTRYEADWRLSWLVGSIAGAIFAHETHTRWASLARVCECDIAERNR